MTIAEFIFGMAGCCAVAFPFFALVGWLFGYRDTALELGVLGALALGLALGRRWPVDAHVPDEDYLDQLEEQYLEWLEKQERKIEAAEEWRRGGNETRTV